MQGVAQQAYMQNIDEQQRLAQMLRAQSDQMAGGAQLPQYQPQSGGGAAGQMSGLLNAYMRMGGKFGGGEAATPGVGAGDIPSMQAMA